MQKTDFDQLFSNLIGIHGHLHAKYQFSADDIRPFSTNQQSMWFLQNMEPQTAIYNAGFSFHILTALNPTHIRKALQLILDRHEVLRAVFPSIDGTPIQIILPQQEVDFATVNATAWTEFDVERAINSFHNKPFDLAADNMLRARLYVVGESQSVLQIVIHHISIDAWSIWLLVDELRRNFTVVRAGGNPDLKPLRYQYSDFAQWQRDMLAGDRGKEMASYWKKELDGDLPILDIPGKRPHSSDQLISYDLKQFVIENDLVANIRELAFGEGTSTYSLLLAVFQMLLSKYSGQIDVLVGTPVHGRGAARFATQVGYFVNLAAMRGDVNPHESFRTLLKKTGEKVQSMLLHQHYPFALVVNQKRPSTGNATQDIVQVIFNLVKPPKKFTGLAEVWLDESKSAQIELDGVVIDQLRVESGYGFSGIELYLEIVDFEEHLAAKLGFNQGLFESEMIAKLAVHFCQLLENAVANPDQSIGQLSMLPQAERNLLLHSWNDTAVSLPQVQFAHTLFAEQAERTPEVVAVLFKGQTYTYQELNERSNQLAHYLRRHGVGPDKAVGIYLDRSFDMVVGLLGILKAGGAYVPLDPDYPHNRLAYMLQDAQPELILSHPKNAVDISKLQDAQRTLLIDDSNIILLEEEWSEIENESKEYVNHESSQDNLAYIIYTSGSTGVPNGVALPHRATTNLILAQLEHSQAGPGRRTLQFTSLSFDVSFQEIFATWCSGGTLVLVDQLVKRDSASLLQYITENGINRLYLPFSALRNLAEAANAYQIYPSSLREIITAGEQLIIDQPISDFFQEIPHCSLENHYGPTETHVVTTFKLDGPVKDWPLLPPIGRPIANTCIYILDKYLQPVPVGVTGELYIGGACLARGYFNNVQLTSERFIVNPFVHDLSEYPAMRLYKTGDLARHLQDGNIEFLGRTDNQVKIRGYRIEPGEIEAALVQHPDIQQTAVIARTDDADLNQLVAYYVPYGTSVPAVDILRQFLLEKLPDFMIPTAFVPLKVMPLMPSGKIDWKTLPKPDVQRPDLAQPYVRPRSPLEQMLVEIWTSVLKVDRIGIHDNFFDLGGHSLLATQVIARIEKVTGFSLPLRIVFERPTIAGLFAFLDQATHDTALPPPMVPVSRDGEIPLSFAQERMWFLHRLAPNEHAYHIPITLNYRQAISRDALQKACDDMVVRHESLRTIFPVADGVSHQKILPPFSVIINEIDLSTIPTPEQETAVIKLVQADTRKPYDLACAPPWRFTLFRFNDESYVFYFAFHHIIFDHWSTVVLWQELHELYQAYSQNEQLELPPLKVQYADFTMWQRSWLQGKVLADLLGYWTAQLANLPVLDMPTDHPRPPVQTFSGATAFHNLTPSLTKKLRSYSRQAQVSPFMLMLAAFKVLLARYSRQTDIAVGVPVANRHYLAVEPIIGNFVNIVVVRTDLSGDPSFTEFLQNVREVLLEAYAHQEMPFEKLVSEIVETRDFSHTPLVQVQFNMTNAPFDHEQSVDSPISFVTFDRGATQHDLSVNVIMEEYLPIEPQLILEYNTALFEQDTIQRFLEHYEALLSAVVMDDRLPISNYEILAPAERAQIINEWNQTEMAYQSYCLHELFMEQAKRTPDKLAVSYEDQLLTYQQLDDRSNQLAHYLQSLGVGPESVVGVFVERSLELVIALFGILKAGGTYLPLDPGFPVRRLDFMIEDAEAEVILTRSDIMYNSPATDAVGPVVLDIDWPLIEHHSTEQLEQTVDFESLAYIVYTSGSTGKPKGIEVEHRNVVNFMTSMRQQPGIASNDVMLSVTTQSFDISMLEICLPLLYGAQVVIVDRLTAADGRELGKAIKRVHASIMQATPTTWSMLIDAGWENTPTLKKVLCGGEVLSRELADAILERNVELWNMYGPTETTIWSSIQRIMPDHGRITIGRPIGNNSFYVLDTAGRPVPIGVAGELFIGGDGVARGYVNRSELTEERFLPDRFTSWSSTGRMYRTGDLVRYLPEGNVEYLGRMDLQVKIHGHRIELGEVEAVLSTHPQVREVVVAVHSGQYDQVLVAYVVFHESEVLPTYKAMRAFLRIQLPDFMVPSVFMNLVKFPLTPNLKIDRNALPDPESFRPDLGNRYIGPRSDLETVLAALMAELLGIETVGMYDDFFELGGHSLLATRYVARVSKGLRTDLPLWQFLRSPNVADLALYFSNLSEGARINRIAELRVKMMAMSPEEIQRQLQLESRSEMDVT